MCKENIETHHFVEGKCVKPAALAYLGQPSESAAKHWTFVLSQRRAVGSALTCYLWVNICHFGQKREKTEETHGKLYQRDQEKEVLLDKQVQRRETRQEVQ